MPDDSFDLIVIGAGPGGYTAAIRASQLGMKVAVVEKMPTFGGTCLNIGCIPSKALLHAAKVVDEAHEMGAHGITFGAPKIDIDTLRGWKDGVVKRLTGGLTQLAKQRKVTVVSGFGRFVSGSDTSPPLRFTISIASMLRMVSRALLNILMPLPSKAFSALLRATVFSTSKSEGASLRTPTLLVWAPLSLTMVMCVSYNSAACKSRIRLAFVLLFSFFRALAMVAERPSLPK